MERNVRWAVWPCGGDDGGVAVVCFLVFLLHSRMLSRVYLPTRSLVTKGQHTLAGHWLLPPSSFFPFTGEGLSLSRSFSLFLSLSFSFLSLSFFHRRSSPVFHINTQIPWHRPGPARVYTGTTAAFHDTRPLFPPFPSCRTTAASLSLVHPTLLYHHRHYRARRARPIFGTLYLLRASKDPSAVPSFRAVPRGPTRLRSDGQTSVSLSIGTPSPFVHGATGCFRRSVVPFSPGAPVEGLFLVLPLRSSSLSILYLWLPPRSVCSSFDFVTSLHSIILLHSVLHPFSPSFYIVRCFYLSLFIFISLSPLRSAFSLYPRLHVPYYILHYLSFSSVLLLCVAATSPSRSTSPFVFVSHLRVLLNYFVFFVIFLLIGLASICVHGCMEEASIRRASENILFTSRLSRFLEFH